MRETDTDPNQENDVITMNETAGRDMEEPAPLPAKPKPIARTTLHTRIRLEYDALIRKYAEPEESNIQAVVEHALHEYFTRRGHDVP